MVHYIQKGNYEVTELDGEWIILNTDDFTVTKVNEMGGVCWELLKEPQSIESIAKALELKLKCEKKLVLEDVKSFLSNLEQCGLIKNVI